MQHVPAGVSLPRSLRDPPVIVAHSVAEFLRTTFSAESDSRGGGACSCNVFPCKVAKAVCTFVPSEKGFWRLSMTLYINDGL